MKKYTLALGTALALIGAQAMAQEVVDTDGDGVYSLEELQASYPDLTPEGFASIDANGDGAVDPDELAAAIADGLLP
ncbi:MAG: EF-hand domain-containing protein [Gemmobacter sp.]